MQEKDGKFFVNIREACEIISVSTTAFGKWKFPAAYVTGRSKYYNLAELFTFRLNMVAKKGTAELLLNEKIKLTSEQAEVARITKEKGELELETIRSERIISSKVEKAWDKQNQVFKARIMSLAVRISSVILQTDTQAIVQDKVRSLATEALEELADYKDVEYGNTTEDTDTSKPKTKTAAKPKRKRMGPAKKTIKS